MIYYQGTSYQPNAAIESPSDKLNKAVRHYFTNEDLVINTSGSTGKPSPIRLSKELLLWSAQNTKAALGLDKEHALICLPLDRIGGRMMLVRGLTFGWELTYQEPNSNPLLIVDNQRFYSFVSLTPHQLFNVISNPNSVENLSKARVVLIGGGMLTKSTEDAVLNHPKLTHVSFFQSYGMTETASHIALRNCRTDEPNEYTLVEGVECTINYANCLRVHIPNHQLNVQTNDIIELLPNRRIKLIGRLDDVVNSGGIKLHLNEVHQAFEALIAKTSLSCPYFFWKQPDPVLGEQLVFIGISNRNQENVETLLHQLPKYFKPKAIRWVDDFQWLASGKVDRINTVANAFKDGNLDNPR